MASLRELALFLSTAVSVVAHGIVSGIVIDGKYYPGYDPGTQFMRPPPTVIGWSIPLDLDRGFINPGNYTSPDIICHKSATPGGMHAAVAAGGEVELQWTAWPESHHGPVLDYLAKCDGDCEKVDKTRLEFFKIYEAGLNEWVTQPGNWASDDLIQNNNSHSVKIPANIAPGNYVLRHEIIALHSANNPDGAQNYPQCINLKITGPGTESPVGVLATELYKASDPGILVNIYWPALTTYVIPGPSMYNAKKATTTTPASSPTQVSTTSTSMADVTSLTIESGSRSAPASSAPSMTSTDDTDATSTTTRTTKVTITSTTTTVHDVAVVYSTAYETAIVTVLITVTGTEQATYITLTTTSAHHVLPAITTISTSSPNATTSKSMADLPSSTASAGAGSPTPPAQALSDGFIFKDLLQWLDYLLAFGSVAKERVHARDLGPV